MGTVIGSTFLGIVTALVLTRAFPGRGIVRTLVILPWAVPHVVAALVWQWMYNPDYGVVNYAIGWLPFVTETPKWLSDPDYALLAIIIVNVWKTYPFATLVLLAGLQTISDDLYEASTIDGAGPVRRFFDITLPGLRHVLAIVVLLLTIWSFGNFVFIFLMTQGGPAGATDALVVKIYFEAFRFFKAGPAFAMGAMLLV
ncbi:MAG: sugar ABC transporter permease, partial [bacterium]|nr:sugar ABC transporter permease [bacterium]